MSRYFSICSTYMYQHRYMDFLLAHYKKLNMPYNFPVTLSYISSPLLMGGGAILCFDDQDEIAGALGYIHGTGEHDYEDRHVIQLQIAFIKEEYRGSRLMVEALQFLLQHIDEQEEIESVQEMRFWAVKDRINQRLFSKFAKRIGSTESEYGGSIDAYAIYLSELRAYLSYFHRVSRVKGSRDKEVTP
ncbi:hypothetical protein J7E78_11810 [Paenibacillus polymyxa]|uniref:hypothetical protein n=1 Tax=Paenibacillus polymyxa TaxID=1406 RepID=UPI001BE70491|nr:hypothetical protein [Paenibacillus polymyxa]MBT2284222.1 hypothetical protein [Paenibacillus polymyxa]